MKLHDCVADFGWEMVELHFFIIGGGVVDQLAVFTKARAVAGAIPCVLGAVVFESATEVGASWCCGGEKSDD